MDYEKITQEINSLGKRARMVERIVTTQNDIQRLKTLQERIGIDDEYVAKVIKLRIPFIENLSSPFFAYQRAQNSKNPILAAKTKNELLKELKKQTNLAEAYHILGILDKEQYIQSKSSTQKFELIETFATLFEEGKITKRELDLHILPAFNKKLNRFIVGVATKNNPILMPFDTAQIFRDVAAGKFQKPKEAIFSQSYIDFISNKIPPEKTTANSYDLLNKSKIFKPVKSSKNIQKILPHIQEKMAKRNIPLNVARNMSSADFYHFAKSIHNDDRAINFSKFAKIEQLTPYQQLCKQISEDKMTFNKIIQDMRANNISEEYIELWKKSMKEDFNHNPDTSNLPECVKIPHKISIHHKKKIQYAGQFIDPSKVNDTSNLAVCIEFEEEDKTHDTEHLGDNKKPIIYRNGKIDTDATKPVEGDVIIAQTIVDENQEEDKIKDACYFSKTMILSSENVKGCNDLSISTSATQERTL